MKYGLMVEVKFKAHLAYILAKILAFIKMII